MASKDPRSVIDPSKFLNKKVRVKFSGGREGEPFNEVLVPTEESLIELWLLGARMGHLHRRLVRTVTRYWLRSGVGRVRRAPLVELLFPLGFMAGSFLRILLPLAVEGTLKGHDAVCNLVLDDTEEFLRGRAPILLPLSVPHSLQALSFHWMHPSALNTFSPRDFGLIRPLDRRKPNAVCVVCATRPA